MTDTSSTLDGALATLGKKRDEAPPDLSVQNQTRARLVIHHGNSALILAPLETQHIPNDRYDRLSLTQLEQLGFVSARPVVAPIERSRRRYLLAGSLYGGVAYLLWGLFVGTSTLYWTALGLSILLAAAVWLWDEDLGVKAVQALYLAIVLVVGVGMPVAAVWAGGDIDDVWNTAINGSGLPQERATLTLLGRGIQTVFIVLVTLLPGLLFFLFNRYRLKTLADEFTRQIFRFDRNVKTCSDLHAKYGHLLTELYGHDPSGFDSSASPTSDSRLQPGTRLPVVLATIVFALGWIVVLLNAEVEVVLLQDGLRSLITPWQSATAYAFLGAYVFIIQAALRAYFRGDLRPKFYSYAALRVILAVIFAWVLDVLISGDEAALLVTAFVVGLVPDTLLHRLRQVVRTQELLSTLTEKHPLTSLDGVDVYDGTRLEQEGVTNVEGIAHSNLVELMLQTRIPAARLVDWADQAQLQLHLDAGDEPGKLPKSLITLRKRGIRTASDLLVAHEAAVQRGNAASFLGILGAPDGGPPLLETVIDTVKDDEWMPQILDWHNPANRVELTLNYPEDFGNTIPSL